jgi:hypothetical protein
MKAWEGLEMTNADWWARVVQARTERADLSETTAPVDVAQGRARRCDWPRGRAGIGAEIVLTVGGEWRKTRLFRSHEQAELVGAIAYTGDVRGEGVRVMEWTMPHERGGTSSSDQAEPLALPAVRLWRFQHTPNGRVQSLSHNDIVTELHLDKDEASRIKWLPVGAGLIEYVGSGPLVRITVEGIDYVEDARLKPDVPTEHFPRSRFSWRVIFSTRRSSMQLTAPTLPATAQEIFAAIA